MKEASEYSNDQDLYIDKLMGLLRERGLVGVSCNRKMKHIEIYIRSPRGKAIQILSDDKNYVYWAKKMLIKIPKSTLNECRLNNTIPQQIKELL